MEVDARRSTSATEQAVRSVTSDSLFLDSVHVKTREKHAQLLDSGSSRELMSKEFAKKQGFPTYELRNRIRLVFMDKGKSEVITHGTQQIYDIGGRRIRIRYALADIGEDMVLGLNFLRQTNPDVDWHQGTVRWREQPQQDTTILCVAARRARKRIVQSEIPSNEPPEWVKRKHAEKLLPKPRKQLPPSREGFDYKITMKPGWEPKRERPRKFSTEERQAFKDLAKAHEEDIGDWQRESNSPQCSQMLWAAKAGGKKRPCVDYRYVNTGIVDDAFPVPVIRDLMMDIAGKKHLTSLDLPNAYNEVRITDPFTQQMLAFQCGDHQYEPKVMQFGSKTAVAWYQRFITHVLRRNVGRGVAVYLDNIIIYADTQEEHDRLLDEVLQDLWTEGLRVRPEKCEWNKNEVMFCGYMVSADGIRLDPEKLRAIAEWEIRQDAPEAAKKTAVREFLGFCNFYKNHVDHYSEIAIPLTALTSKNYPWRWGDAEELSFRKLKEAIMLSPVVGAHDPELPKEVNTDASDDAIAGCVQQRDKNGNLRPIGFYSKKLNPAERNYTVHDKELLAIVKTFEAYRHWLHGTKDPVKVWTDHSALKWFLTTTKLTQRHARWAEKLGEFRFKILHIPGRQNRAADALSRKDTHDGVERKSGGVSPLTPDHFS